VQDQRPHILGAAFWISSTRMAHSIRLHVIPEYRRQGIGSLLLRRIVTNAHELGNGGLATVVSSNDPAAGPFLTQHGFQKAGSITTVEIDKQTAQATLLPLADRFSARERNPEQRKIVRLADAPRNAVTALYLAELARNPGTAPWALLDQISTPRYAGSPVYLSEGRVSGFMLFSIEGDLCAIPARIVAREFQGGPVNLLLMAYALRVPESCQVNRVQFDIPENNRDTESLARRLNTRTVRTRDSYFRGLDAVESPDFDYLPRAAFSRS